MNIKSNASEAGWNFMRNRVGKLTSNSGLDNRNSLDKFALLIPVFNGGKFLSDALDSVLAQDCFDFKVYICDDGSRDNSPQIIQEFISRFPGRATLISHSSNLGTTQTLIDLCKAASQECNVAILLAQDDMIPKNYVSDIASYFVTQNNIVLTSCAILIDDRGARIGNTVAPPWIDYLGSFKSALLLASNVVNACGVAFGLIDFRAHYLGIDNPHTQDWNQWIFLSPSYRFICASRTNVFYRRHNHNTSKVNNSKSAHLEIHKTRLKFLNSIEFMSLCCNWTILKKKSYFIFVKLLFRQFPLCQHNVEFLENLATTLSIGVRKRTSPIYEACSTNQNLQMDVNENLDVVSTTSTNLTTNFVLWNWIRIVDSSLRLVMGRAYRIVASYPKRLKSQIRSVWISGTGGLATQLMTLSYGIWLQEHRGRKTLISFRDKGLSYFPLVIKGLLMDFTFKVKSVSDSERKSKVDRPFIQFSSRIRDKLVASIKGATKFVAKRTSLVVSDHYLSLETLEDVNARTLKVGGYNVDWRVIINSWSRLSQIIDETQQENFMKDAGYEESVSIHWRLGDYHSNPIIDSTHGTVSPESILNCLETLSQTTKFQKVKVFSDSPQLAKELLGNVPFAKGIEYVQGEIWDCLYAMTRSRGFIGTNSGISGWAAIAISKCNPNSKVLLPDKWFKNPPAGFNPGYNKGIHPAEVASSIRTYQCRFM